MKIVLRGALAAVIGLASLSGPASLLGCASPCDYPDRSSPICAYRTFVKAWKLGDLDVIEDSYSPTRVKTLREGEKIMGREALREWYRMDADRIVLGTPKADEFGPDLAHISVPVRDDRPGGGAWILHFDLTRAPVDWKIYQIRRSGSREPGD